MVAPVAAFMPTYGLNEEEPNLAAGRYYGNPQVTQSTARPSTTRPGVSGSTYNYSEAPGAGSAGAGNPAISRPYLQNTQPSSAAFANYDAASAGRPPTTNPGQELYSPGLSEQAFNYTQNQYLNDPWSGALQDQYDQTQNPSAGEQWLGQNLGTLSGPGQGDQYWNQISGQFAGPGAGQTFTQNATAAFSPQGASSGAYANAQNNLGGGTQAESNLGAIAGGYSQYAGGNNALGQYQTNAGYGPMAAQSFYDQVGGSYGSLGQYGGPNLSSGQYAQTQAAFGDLPIAEFDPYYDRAQQLGVQGYNQQAAGRGVYGSSEALSGVGNVITDIAVNRARDSFGAEMQRAQEQRARQQLLGEQARMGDLSELGAFQANLSGLQTFGTLANQAGNQTLAQQEMLGNQARAADQTGLDAFSENTEAATAYGNINTQMGNLQLDRERLLGDLANNADVNETNRYEASTRAMLDADRVGNERAETGANIAFGVDDGNREDFTATANAANNQAQIEDQRIRTGADIANTGSVNDLNRINSFNEAAGSAEGQRQERINSMLNNMASMSRDVGSAIQAAQEAAMSGDQAALENIIQMQLAPALEAAGVSREQAQQMVQIAVEGFKATQKPTG